MRNRTHEIVLGAVVFVAIAIVVVGTVWLSERYAGAAGGHRLQVKFESVPGLQVGNPVTFRGVWVGKVLGIRLEQGQPIVTLGFANLDGLPKDSQILIKSDGLLGGQMIEIQMGVSPDVFANDALVEGVSNTGIEKAVEEGGQVVEKVNVLMSEVASPANLNHFNQTIARFDSTTQIVQAMFVHNQASLTAILDSLASASGQANGLLGDNRSDLRQSVENLKQSSDRMVLMSEDMQAAALSMKETFDNLNHVSKQVRQGKGMLGRLVNDEAMYEQVQHTLSSVDSLINDIKRDPSRYFKFTVF